MKRIYTFVALLALVACCGLTGCEKPADTTTPDASTNASSLTATNL